MRRRRGRRRVEGQDAAVEQSLDFPFERFAESIAPSARRESGDAEQDL
jgi:hypothetical protein